MNRTLALAVHCASMSQTIHLASLQKDQVGTGGGPYEV